MFIQMFGHITHLQIYEGFNFCRTCKRNQFSYLPEEVFVVKESTRLFLYEHIFGGGGGRFLSATCPHYLRTAQCLYTGGGGHDETDDDYDKDDGDTDYDTDDDVILVMMKKEEDAFCIFLDNGWWQIVCPDVHNTSELFNAYNDGDTDDVKGGHNDDDSGVYDAEN